MNWIASVFILCSVCHLCPAYEFHFVTEKRNWTEARKYCREHHVDLATIRDSFDMEMLNNTVNQTADVWIGLHVGWQWSLANTSFYREGEEEFRSWGHNEPNNEKEDADADDQNCSMIGQDGLWSDDVCVKKVPFICYNGLTKSFITVTVEKTWTSAQNYCRENYTDLASVRNQTENEEVSNALQERDIMEGAWIGLYRGPWRWSDQSNSNFTDWANNQPDNKDGKQDCVVAFREKAGKDNGTWDDEECHTELPFACYDDELTLVDQNLTWDQALAYCRGNDSDLVSVHSQEVQQLVAQVAGRASSPFVWLGLKFTCTLGYWFWVNGEPVCYSHWAPGNGTGARDCGSTGALDTQGEHLWVSQPQTEKFNFICTKSEDY